MLEFAYLYKEEVKKKYASIIGTEPYKWFVQNNYHSFEIIIEDSTWNSLDFVSRKNNIILGFMSARIDRQANNINSLEIIRFLSLDESETLRHSFAIDIRRFVRNLLTKYQFHKINFSVIVGSPYEQHYDQIMKYIGGRIVGIYKEDVILSDNQLYDRKLYEIMRSDIICKRR